MSTARDDLLARTIEYVAANGMSELSLRELAAAVGSSHRMLIYHFESRDGLVAAIVDALETQQREALDSLASNAASPRGLVLAQWAQLTDPALRPFIALFFEVLALAVHRRPGTEGFLAGLTDPWIELADRLADDLGTAVTVDDLRLGVAVIRGLLIEVLASGDTAGPTASLERFLDLWQPVDA